MNCFPWRAMTGKYQSPATSKQMNSLKDDDGPEKSEAPDIADVIEELGLDEGGRSNEPVEGRERRRCVVLRDLGSGVG